jgi:hypothetical protein
MLEHLLTHMPFLTYDLQGQRVLFFTVAECVEPHYWKIYYTVNDGNPSRLETGFSHNIIECSPTAWHDESGWHLSFIAVESTGIGRLYRMDGKTLEYLSQPVAMRTARTGFVYKERIAVGEIQDLVHIHDNNGDHKIEIPGTFIYRVAYRADEPEKILISGDWIGENEEPFTLEYNLTNDSQQYIECDGQGAYKCTIYKDEILYAERTGTNFEHRHIRNAKEVKGVCCQMAHRHQDGMSTSLITITKKCGCRRNDKDISNDKPVRPSCLECVEKHLGAAFVIASEIHDGYAYRLRFIGHLHEAEDESQEFLKLHEMIRSARKSYQREGTIPDWEILAQEIMEIKNAR